MIHSFKTLNGKKIDDIIAFIKEYKKEHKDINIFIGCDSQSNSKKTIYGVTIVLYTKGKGGLVLCKRDIQSKEYNLQVRLLTEVSKAIEIAEFIKENGITNIDFIDIDINPYKKYKSNTVFSQAVGMVEGMGYKVRYKHNGAVANRAANTLVRQ